MSEILPQVDRKRSFLRLICPFRFQATALPAIIKRAEQTSSGGTTMWNPLRYQALLPGVGRYINAPESQVSSAAFWSLNKGGQSRNHGLSVGKICHFTVKRKLYAVRLEAVELALFASGIGFVILEFEASALPKGCLPTPDFRPPNDPSVWIDLAKLLRRGQTFHDPVLDTHFDTLRAPTIATRTHRAPRSDAFSIRDYVSFILSTVQLRLSWSTEEAIDVPSGEAVLLLEQNLMYMSLFLSGASDETMRNWTALLRYSIGFGAGSNPGIAELALGDQGIQRRSERSYLYGSLVAAGFIGTDLPAEGYWQQFPTELRREYQFALLLALQQRHALLTIGSLVSDRWLYADATDRVSEFSHIQDRFQYLSARLMPVQCGRRLQQQRYYTTVRHAFEIQPLYDDLRQTVSDLTSSLRLKLTEAQSQQQLRFERRVSTLALVLGVPSLVLAFLAIDVDGISKPMPLLIAILLIVASFTLGLIATFTIGRRSSLRP